VPIYFIQVTQGYTVRKIDKEKWISYILVSAGMKFRNKKKFRYGIPAHTGPFRVLSIRIKQSDGDITLFPLFQILQLCGLARCFLQVFGYMLMTHFDSIGWREWWFWDAEHGPGRDAFWNVSQCGRFKKHIPEFRTSVYEAGMVTTTFHSIKCCCCYRFVILQTPITVVAWSKAWFLTAWTSVSWVRVLLKAWMFFLVFRRWYPV
jgi:hypothetical protein